MEAVMEVPELNFTAIDTTAPEEDAGSKPKKGRKHKQKAAEEMTVPNVPRRIPHRDLVEQIWTDLKLEQKDGFYCITNRDIEEKGVVAYADCGGRTEVRLPFDKIKGLFRIQYVSDMQADTPLILASMYMVYFEPVEGYSVAFAYVDEGQFNTLNAMLGPKVTRSYTYHDLADNKRGYTFDHEDFPSKEEQAKYLQQCAPVIERKEEYVESPAAQSGADETEQPAESVEAE